MEFLEKDLEEIIYLSDKQELSDRGLCLHGKLKRQLRIGNYGITDLVEFKRPFYHPYLKMMIKGEINVIELKNKKIGVSTFFQALNYVKGIQSYFESKEIDFDNYNIRITLIGREFDKTSSFCYLGDLFGTYLEDTNLSDDRKISVDLYKYTYSLNGIEFDTITGYNLTNKGF